jgi:uncharacterized protein
MRTQPFLLALALAFPAVAQHEAPPGADPGQFKPLAERSDVVSWKTFAQVELVKMKDRYVPQFSQSVTSLDQKDVRVQGFMMPLQVGDKQSHFVLAALPVTCSFCMPGGPEALVEVKTKQPLKYTFDPIIVSGKLSVLKDDPTGVFYRITDAVQAK